MAATIVELSNVALSILGEPPITSLDEGTDAASLIKERWDMTRRSVLRDHPWSFAIGRSQLTKEASSPEFGYLYQYPLPVDFVSAISIDEYEHLNQRQFDSASRYAIESDRLLTDANEVYLTYVRDITDVSKFDPLFDEVAAYKLAQNIAFHLTGSHGNTDVARTLYKESLKKARSRDAWDVGYRRQQPDAISKRPR